MTKSKREQIIEDLISDYGVDYEFFVDDESILCNGDNCRSDECGCWDEFETYFRGKCEAMQKEAK